MDRGAWRAIIHGVAKSWARLSDWTHTEHVVDLLWIFWRASILFSIVAEPVHSHQPCTRVPFSPDPHQHLFSFVFLMRVILTSVRLYLIVAFTCTCLMINDVNIFPRTCWPFECLLWKKVHFVPLPILKFALFEGFCYWVNIWVLYIFYWHIVWKSFLPFYKLSFNFVNCFFCCEEAFKFAVVSFVEFCFCFNDNIDEVFIYLFEHGMICHCRFQTQGRQLYFCQLILGGNWFYCGTKFLKLFHFPCSNFRVQKSILLNTLGLMT